MAIYVSFDLTVQFLCVQDKDTDAAKAFLTAAATIDDHPFAITSDDAVLGEYKVEGEKVLLFKKVMNATSYLEK